MHFISKYQFPVGRLTLASDGENLTGLWMDGQKYFGSTLDEVYQEKQLPIFQQAEAWLDTYFEGQKPKITFPIAPLGSPFRRAVWELLLQIPYGQVTTYGALANQLEQQTGKRASAQAVGGAVGHNPIGIIIPCHRVVGSSGSLTGYAGGIEKKIQLLQLEGIPAEHFFVPKTGTV
ncbi:MAG: methylated-DNA--[protein]-cysteine S-methyltransferase [Clostridia bacterium]|nr:methylated-DNA--[protein]-cysteine S-methyltransferase [Clostridia bacterium]